MAKKPPPPGTPPDDDDETDGELSPKLLEVLNNTVSAAVTAQIGRKLKPINDQITQLGTSITEQLEAFASRGAGGAPPKKPGDPDPGAGSQPDPDKIAMKRRLDAIEEERKQERADARNARRDAKLTELAVTAGVEKNRVRGAVAVLREATFFDKEGTPMMKVARTGYDEDADLDTGAAEFFKSDEGKSYLAPQGKQGAGGGAGAGQQRGSSAAGVVNRGGGGASGGSSNRSTKDQAEAKNERKAKALEDLSNGIGALIGGGSIDIG